MGLGRIAVERFALNATNVTPGTGVQITNFAANRITDRIRLDFGVNGITGARNTNAGDGFYRVRVDVNGDSDFADPEDAAFEFHRLLGDANGDAVVNSNASGNATDLNIVNSQQGRSGTLLQGDIDGSGTVNVFDRVLAIQANGRSLDEALRALLDD